MRFNWLQDPQTQNHFIFYWKPGGENEVDYFTKNHPTIHHRTKKGRCIKNFIDQLTSIYPPM